MKHIQLFSCLLFTAIATHCMENQQNNQQAAPENPWKAINCQAIEKNLNDDYDSYLKQRLEDYKTNDFTQQTMTDLQTMGNFITGKQNIGLPYNHIRDKQGDSFITIAVKKRDVPIVNWHTTIIRRNYISQKDFNTCIATCMQYLSPKETDKTKRDTTYTILKRLTLKHGHYTIVPLLRNKSDRKNLIKQLITLQIKHKRHSSNFVIEDELITQHLTSGENDQSPIAIADIYQMIANKKGNTLSHLVVTSQDPDELWKLITKEYVSPFPNKEEKTVLNLAHAYFQSFSKDAASFDIYREESQHARCCLFMLLNYIKSKQNNQELATFTPCCDKHTVKK